MSQSQINLEEQNKILASIDFNKIIDQNIVKIEKAQIESIASDRANKEPIPESTMETFVDNDLIVATSIGNVKIRKLKALDITIFKLTDSPFYKLYMGDVTEDGTEKEVFSKIFPDEEVLFQVVYQFTNDIKEVYKLAKQGKEKYYATAIESVGFIYEPADVLLLVNSILNHIGLVNKARVSFEEPVDDKKKVI